MSKRFCRCGAVVKDFCERCDSGRHKAAAKGYDSRWTRLSRDIRKERPLCEDCEKHGRVRPSEEVHHIKGSQVAPHLMYERSNLVALCFECHKRRHGGKIRKYRN
jgi:5-methylcytosine-specific restriction protein A